VNALADLPLRFSCPGCYNKGVRFQRIDLVGLIYLGRLVPCHSM